MCTLSFSVIFAEKFLTTMRNIRRFFFVFLTATMLWGCLEENYTTDPNHQLSFSTEELTFDTLFNTIASRTQSFLVYNKNKKAIKINAIRLASGAQSYFRLNVNGVIDSENILNDIDIAAKDSMFIFVELTIAEQADDKPVFVKDAILFEANGNTQQVNLTAYGQNVTIFDNKIFKSDTTLDASRPFLIYNNLYVNDGCTLTLKQGVRLHLHNNANIVVNGNLIAEGTLEEPIKIQGDRLDKMNDVDNTPYSYLPGQWGAIYLQSPNGQHSLKNVDIIGGTNGILLIGSTTQMPTLTVENSYIHTMTNYGICTLNGNTNIANTEISNCGISCLNIVGGENKITHCTIADYYEWDIRETPAVKISNYLIDGNWLYIYELQSAVFQNTILFGNRTEELALDKDTISQKNNAYNIYFSECLIKGSKINSTQFNNIIWASAANNAELFKNTSIKEVGQTGYYDFSLLSNASARNKANAAVSALYPTDRKGANRFADGNPDIGAYEYQ